MDTKTLDISFNEPIDTNTVRVTISEQSTRANVRVGEYTGGTDQNTVRVSLLDLLDPNTDYRIVHIHDESFVNNAYRASVLYNNKINSKA